MNRLAAQRTELPEIPAPESIVVEDDEYTNSEPTNDRNQLVTIVQHLAHKVGETLVQDATRNRRFAGRLVISNKLALFDEINGILQVDGTRENILVKLPLTVDTWNELDEDDIALEMCKAVVDIHEEYTWYQVQVVLDQFMSQKTRRLIDMLEVKEVDKEAAKQLEQEIHQELTPRVTEPKKEDDLEDEFVNVDDDDDENEDPNGAGIAEVKSDLSEEEIVVDDLSNDANANDSDAESDIMIVEEIKAPARPPPTPKTLQMTNIQKSLRMLNTKR